jgi:palmitoyltransferase
VKDFKNLLFEQKEEFDHFCFKCSMFKSETRKHCVVCDKCCEEFDHHCFWLDKCVGKNNYISFIFLLYLSTIDFIITIFIAIYTLLNAFYFEKKKSCNINNYIEPIYQFIKENLSHIEITYNFIPENAILENIHIIFLLAIDILALIPLIYLVILHTKNCKKKNKSKTSIRKINQTIENINQDQLLSCNSENDSSIGSLEF